MLRGKKEKNQHNQKLNSARLLFESDLGRAFFPANSLFKGFFTEHSSIPLPPYPVVQSIKI
jgi:hypothetical protein